MGKFDEPSSTIIFGSNGGGRMRFIFIHTRAELPPKFGVRFGSVYKLISKSKPQNIVFGNQGENEGEKRKENKY